MSEHTPGPWRVGTAGPNGCVTIGTKQGLMTAMVSHSLNEPSQKIEAVANARLIAAAPDLLYALQVMTKVYSDTRKALLNMYPKEGWTAETMTIDLANTAITKATGAE